MRSVADKFQVIQLGLCLFVAEKPGNFVAHPYNIYLFPEERPGTTNGVLLDLEGMSFHKQQGLDFNKWIYEGVSYLNEKQERLLFSKVSEGHPHSGKEVLNLTEEDTKKTELALNSIEMWVQNGARAEHVISDFNPYLRKFMYQKIEELYPGLNVGCESKGKFDKNIVLKMLTEEEKRVINDAKMKESVKAIKRKSGARRIFKALIGMEKVPIIGHNPLFDLLFLYSAFQDELPGTLAEFKSKIHGLFPTIYDTMLIANDEKMKQLFPEKQSLGLEAIYSFLNQETKMKDTKIIISESNSKYAKGSHYHEAGYDSYITGIICNQRIIQRILLCQVVSIPQKCGKVQEPALLSQGAVQYQLGWEGRITRTYSDLCRNYH
eukprot:TRINITY_DN89660_c0_g1_i1.p1 TRINITY_DN89660_c0_g1~~TRINITY_DN89660_c0_g1_i1.p1  ORF type:complete len:378 (+),score=46.83 TRINITY_DN89660_c0_g1_i1:352-1485(+)